MTKTPISNTPVQTENIPDSKLAKLFADLTKDPDQQKEFLLGYRFRDQEHWGIADIVKVFCKIKKDHRNFGMKIRRIIRKNEEDLEFDHEKWETYVLNVRDVYRLLHLLDDKGVISIS